MATKIEFIYGDRQSGKTDEIINSIEDRYCIGIVSNFTYQKQFRMKIGKEFRNIVFLKDYRDCYGRHFDKVFIDDADSLDWKQWLLSLRDSMNEYGGKIYIYFRPPVTIDNFSVRVLNGGE